MSTPISGKNGSVSIGGSTVLDVTGWNYSEEVVTTRYASSATAGCKNTIPGVVSGSGSFAFKFNPSATPVTPNAGDVGTGIFHLDTSATYLTFGIVIKKVALTVDIDNGTAIGGTADFETNSATALGSTARTGFSFSG